jgi:hypothetical protein
LFFLAVPLFAAPSIVRADDVDGESEQHMQHGIELRRLGKNREALEAFQRAYDLRPTPRASAQIALARQALADWVGAERGIEDALQAAEDPWIARYRDVLAQALTTVRGHLATLYVEANVTQGELLLNGSPSGPVPAPDQPLRVVAGTLPFEVRAPGYTSVRRTLEIAPGAQVHVVITLDPLASPAPGVAFTPPDARGTEQGVSLPREPFVGAPRLDARRTLWAYVALGGAGVLAGAGVVAWRVRENNVSIYNDNSRCLVSTRTRAEQCAPQANAANLALGVEIAAFAAAVGSAGIGGWLLLSPQARSSSASVTTCVPWTTFGVLCSKRF